MDRSDQLWGSLLTPLPSEGLADRLLAPPRNPAQPPQGLADALAAVVRNSEIPSHSILNVLGPMAKHNLEFAKLPGRMMQGVQPETHGQLTEEDQFRANHLANQPYEWAPPAAFSEVFWPRRGTNVGGSGFAVGSGAMPPKAATAAGADIGAIKKQLEGALQSKDPTEFPTIFGGLKALHPDDAKALAKEFYPGPTPKNQKQALEQIWSRWRKLKDF